MKAQTSTQWYHEILWIVQLSCIILAPLGFIWESIRSGFKVGVLYSKENFIKCNYEFKRLKREKKERK